MSIHTLALFFLASCLAALSPGPDILTVITRSVAQGVWAGVVASLGFATGLIFHTTFAAVGFTLLVQQSPVAFRVVQLAGAAYLVYLAIRMFLAKDSAAVDQLSSPPAERRALWRIYGQSILMNALNPKVWAFFLSLLWQFVDKDASFGVPAQTIILGSLFALSTILCFGACALLAGQLSRLLRKNPKAGRPLRLATGAVFILIAVAFLLTKAKS